MKAAPTDRRARDLAWSDDIAALVRPGRFGRMRELVARQVSPRDPGGFRATEVPTVRGAVVSRRALFGRLAEAQRLVQISAPAGSGKTVLVRSWIAEAGLAGRVAWAPAGRDERDPRRFWVGVADALRGRAAGTAGRWWNGC